MKKLKLMLPSIALMLVLAFAVTVGVYALAQMSYSINASIEFQTPDLDLQIDCYLGTNDGTPDYTWKTGDTTSWSDLDLTFTETDEDGNYLPMVLTFVVINTTPYLPVYCYFVKTENITNGESDFAYRLTTDTIVTTKGSYDLLTATFTDKVAQPIQTGATVGNELTITFQVDSTKSVRNDTATFNYTLIATKENPVVSE